MRAWLAAVLILCAVPVFAQEEAAAPPSQPSGEIATTPAAGDDAAIRDRIRSIIGELDGFESVDVTVREGIVTYSGDVLDASRIPRLDEIAARVDGVVAIQNDVVEDTDVGRRIDPVLDRFRTRLAQAVNYLPLLVIALVAGGLVTALGVALARWDRLWLRLAPNAFIAEIYRTVLRLAFFVIGAVVALDILNATALLSTLLGAAGIIGLAVGFAVRDTVENFIASVMLSLRQPFQPDDIVDIEGSMGTVIRLTSRATILLDPDGNHLRLPNAVVFKAKIINYTRNHVRRFGFALGIDPNDDLAAAKRIGTETLASLDFVLDDPPPQAWVAESGDSTVTMEFYGWLDQRATAFHAARGEALRVVMAALTRADIGLPEPSYRLNIGGGGLPVLDLPDKANRPETLVATEADPPPDAPNPAPEDVAADTTISRMVSEERRKDPRGDLLSHGAPPE